MDVGMEPLSCTDRKPVSRGAGPNPSALLRLQTQARDPNTVKGVEMEEHTLARDWGAQTVTVRPDPRCLGSWSPASQVGRNTPPCGTQGTHSHHAPGAAGAHFPPQGDGPCLSLEHRQETSTL